MTGRYRAPRDCLADAIARRRQTPAPISPLDALRWVNGEGDGAYPGLVVDGYAEFVVVMARTSVPAEVVDEWVDACARQLAPKALVVKRVAPTAGASSSEVVEGALPPGPVMVREGDATFECLLDDGLQTGLFLDHRDTRQRVRPWARGVEVLNLFAYTGAFSVHAALAGARRVTSVDVSKRALRWGRANMTASGLSPDEHRWFSDDVLAHLRRGPPGQYGLVILDPPVLGRASKSTFSLSNDLPALFAGAVRKLAANGILVFSTHARRLSTVDLQRQADFAAAALGRSADTIAEWGLPSWDHPTTATASDLDRGDYLKTLVLRFP